ncbi:MAG TPA: hypothetical protein VH300_20210 [Thermoleophilaceae bacterium]|nr:hypothetical protein [Thermoleophilaceae bacterium]
MRRTVLPLAVLAAAVVAAVASGHPVSGAPKCQVFPKNNPWNQRVDKLPVVHNSDAIVRSIGAGGSVHADFGSGLYNGAPIGIPYTTVSKRQKTVHVSFDYADESDRGPYPVPPRAPVEGGRNSDGDRHVIVVDRDACKLYELYAAYPQNGGKSWKAGSGAIWSLNSNKLRPATWTSADAAGLPILPGLARYEDFKKGGIDHALRFTASRTRKAFIYPARHYASTLTDPDLPPMGQRLRLKSSFNVSGFPKQARTVLTALKRYGMILADNGSPWYITGAPSKGWNNDDLHTLGKVKGSDFEVVDTSKLRRP